MGNDGGTIAKRKDILSLHGQDKYADDTTQDKESIRVTCALSSLPLYHQPIVSDYKGKLYLKEKILEYLIAKKKTPALQHIKSLKDVVDLKVTWSHGHRPAIQCPVTRELKVRNVYGYLRPCGCVMSNLVLEELSKMHPKKPVESGCPSCGTAFHFDYDRVILNQMADEEYATINEVNMRYVALLGMSHSKKKRKRTEGNRAKHTQEDKGKDIETAGSGKQVATSQGISKEKQHAEEHADANVPASPTDPEATDSEPRPTKRMKTD